MSLDFAILGPDRRVQEEVRVELSEHSVILDVAIALQCTMYLRVRGFWDRVLYDHHDLPLFAAELQEMHDSVPDEVSRPDMALFATITGVVLRDSTFERFYQRAL